MNVPSVCIQSSATMNKILICFKIALYHFKYQLDIKEYQTSGEICRLTNVGIFHSDEDSLLGGFGYSADCLTGIRAGSCSSWYSPQVGIPTGNPVSISATKSVVQKNTNWLLHYEPLKNNCNESVPEGCSSSLSLVDTCCFTPAFKFRMASSSSSVGLAFIAWALCRIEVAFITLPLKRKKEDR